MSRVRTGTTTRSPLTTSGTRIRLRLLRSRQRARVRRIRFIRVPRHTHPGEEVILEGTWEYTVEGKPPVTLKAGGVLFIPAGTIHSARNVGIGRAAELATYTVEKGKPLITVVQ